MLACLLLAPGASADSAEVWNGAEYETLNTQRMLLRLRAEFRSSNAFRQFLSTRGIADMRFPTARHFSVVGQLQTVASHPKLRGWEDYNRGMAGVEIPFERGGVSCTARVAGEHFWYLGRPDYRRHRERLVLRLARVRFQPQLGGETIWDAKGWAATRTMSGLSFPFSPRLQLEAGYYYDFRPARQGGNRHILYTYFRFRRPRG